MHYSSYIAFIRPATSTARKSIVCRSNDIFTATVCVCVCASMYFVKRKSTDNQSNWNACMANTMYVYTHDKSGSSSRLCISAMHVRFLFLLLLLPFSAETAAHCIADSVGKQTFAHELSVFFDRIIIQF